MPTISLNEIVKNELKKYKEISGSTSYSGAVNLLLLKGSIQKNIHNENGILTYQKEKWLRDQMKQKTITQIAYEQNTTPSEIYHWAKKFNMRINYGIQLGRKKNNNNEITKNNKKYLDLHKNNNKKRSVVYFIQEVLSGAIKIGVSTNLEKRLYDLMGSNPNDLKILFFIYGDRDDEHKLHNKFRSYNIRREWFKPAPELLEFIDDLKNKN